MVDKSTVEEVDGAVGKMEGLESVKYYQRLNEGTSEGVDEVVGRQVVEGRSPRQVTLTLTTTTWSSEWRMLSYYCTMCL